MLNRGTPAFGACPRCKGHRWPSLLNERTIGVAHDLAGGTHRTTDMIAAWKQVTEQLHTAAHACEVLLPEDPIAIGQWHQREAHGGGAYLLFPTLPFVALFTGDADRADVEVWRADRNRLLTSSLEHRLAEAIRKRPLFERDHSILSSVSREWLRCCVQSKWRRLRSLVCSIKK